MEKSQFSNPLARILTTLIDGIIVGVPLAISYFSESQIISISFFVVAITFGLYNSIYLWRVKRASLGMQLLGLKAFKLKGEEIDNNQLTFLYIISRNVISNIISDITYGIENIFIFFTKRKQTLHDLIFRSVFIGNPKSIKKYYLPSLFIVIAIILSIIFSPYAFEQKNTLVY